MQTWSMEHFLSTCLSGKLINIYSTLKFTWHMCTFEENDIEDKMGFCTHTYQQFPVACLQIVGGSWRTWVEPTRTQGEQTPSRKGPGVGNDSQLFCCQATMLNFIPSNHLQSVGQKRINTQYDVVWKVQPASDVHHPINMSSWVACVLLLSWNISLFKVLVLEGQLEDVGGW